MLANSKPLNLRRLLVLFVLVLGPLAYGQDADLNKVLQLPKLKLVTPDRIEQMNAPEKLAWQTYLEQSNKIAMLDRQQLFSELKTAGLSKSNPAPSSSVQFEIASDKHDAAWFRTDEANQLVANLLSFQTPAGGWSKSVDFSKGPRAKGMHWTNHNGNGWHYCGTLDNRATTEQIQFLAAHFTATQHMPSRQGAIAGIEWLLAAQYPTGGWPQVYPLEAGYHEAITLNDGAMQHALEVLTLVAKGSEPFAFVDASLRQRAQEAVDRGMDCLLRAQVVIDGQRTVWCAQHDPIDLQPLAARAKEPPSLSGAESADLVKFMMRKADDSPAARTMIESAVKWLDENRVTHIRKIKNAEGRTDYVADETSTEVYWARFYDLKTQKPIFAGGQDGIVYDTFTEMAKNNKVSYDYYTTRPRDVVTKELQRWKKRVGL